MTFSECRANNVFYNDGKESSPDEISGILQVKCKVGDVVTKGQTLVVLEAMKMEYPITAPSSGQVTIMHTCLAFFAEPLISSAAYKLALESSVA